MLMRTTCVIAHRKYLVLQRIDGTSLIDVNAKDQPSEFFEHASLVDVVSFLYNRAQRGERLVREN